MINHLQIQTDPEEKKFSAFLKLYLFKRKFLFLTSFRYTLLYTKKLFKERNYFRKLSVEIVKAYL